MSAHLICKCYIEHNHRVNWKFAIFWVIQVVLYYFELSPSSTSLPANPTLPSGLFTYGHVTRFRPLPSNQLPCNNSQEWPGTADRLVRQVVAPGTATDGAGGRRPPSSIPPCCAHTFTPSTVARRHRHKLINWDVLTWKSLWERGRWRELHLKFGDVVGTVTAGFFTKLKKILSNKHLNLCLPLKLRQRLQ